MKTIYPIGTAQDTRQSDRILAKLEPLLSVRNDSLRWDEFIAEAIKADGSVNVPENPQECCRAITAIPAVGQSLLGLVNTFFISGFKNVQDSTKGWVRVISADNFLPQHAFSMFHSARLERGGMGEANSGFFGFIGAENWLLGRYATQITLDEKDLIGGRSVNLYLRAVEEIGRAAGRVPIDLVYALLLRNSTLAIDGQALFSTAHENVSSSTLDQTNLDTGLAAIANQTAPDGAGNLVHQNLSTKYLMTAPALLGTARRAARNMVLGDGNDLVVIPESRLGSKSFMDPYTEQLHTGANTAWMLASSSIALPSIVVGSLNGDLTPTTRTFDLAGPGSPGQWGLAIDAVLDCGAAALDYRGIYLGGVSQ
jgi:hypothetical protein